MNLSWGHVRVVVVVAVVFFITTAASMELVKRDDEAFALGEAETTSLEKVGFFWDVWGYGRYVRLDGDFAYLPIGESDEGIQIVDVSEPTAPKRAGGLPFGWIYFVDAKDDVAFCGPRGERGIVLYDTADKAHPKELMTLPTEDANINFQLFGDLLVIWTGGDSILYDVANALKPRLMATIKGVRVSDIVEKQGWCSDGRKVDLTDPTHPKVRGAPVEGSLLEIVKGYAYFRSEDGSIAIYRQDNLRDPVNNVKIYEDGAADNYYHGFQVVGDRAYFVNPAWGFVPTRAPEYSACAGLWILDVSDPSNPRVAGHWGVEYAQEHQTPMRLADIRVRGRIAYVMDSMFGLRLFDVSDPTDIKRIADYKCGGEIAQINVSENRVYFGEYLSGGITILSSKNPSKPRKEGYLYTGGYIYQFAAYNDAYLYFDYHDGDFQEQMGFAVADIRDITNPRIVYRENKGIGPVKVFGDYLLAHNGLYSLNDPLRPRKLADLAGQGSYIGRGKYVYYALHRQPKENNNFKIFDISNPTEPRIVGQLTISGDNSMISRPMQFVGNRLYIGSCSEDVHITEIDVSDPTASKVVGEYKNLGAATEGSYNFHIAGNRLYTFQYYAGENNGTVYDISMGLRAAKPVQRIPGFYSWHSAILGKFIYVSRLNGLEIFEITGR
ncbi:MAG TPA: hypothetical protein VI727_04005 [Candidatus Brocadiaceae bacterium]|nr:hypothetical protein [Candidatus Brocadiaceae bacterium]